MSGPEIFRIHLVIGMAAWALFVSIFWWPALDAAGRRQAFRQIAMLHAFRFEGLLFLMPAFVGAGLPAAFAVPAAYGDLTASILAIASIATFQWERTSLVFTLLYTLIGTADLINNFYLVITLGISNHPESFGVTYLIPILYVPLLLITHGITLWFFFARAPAARLASAS